MTALDTDILVALLKNDPDAIERIKILQDGGDHTSTTMITAYELVKGAYVSSRANENLAKINETLSNLPILELSFGASEEAATIYKELRDGGKMIGEFDILIAGIVKFNDETLITRDEHFKTIRGIKVVNW